MNSKKLTQGLMVMALGLGVYGSANALMNPDTIVVSVTPGGLTYAVAITSPMLGGYQFGTVALAATLLGSLSASAQTVIEERRDPLQAVREPLGIAVAEGERGLAREVGVGLVRRLDRYRGRLLDHQRLRHPAAEGGHALAADLRQRAGCRHRGTLRRR